MTFAEKKKRIKEALEHGYYVTGTRKEWDGWSALYNENGTLKFTRGHSPVLKEDDQIRVAIQIDIKNWDTQLEGNLNI